MSVFGFAEYVIERIRQRPIKIEKYLQGIYSESKRESENIGKRSDYQDLRPDMIPEIRSHSPGRDGRPSQPEPFEAFKAGALHSDKTCVVLTGEGGSGKTIILNQIWWGAFKCKRKNTPYIPVFIDIKTVCKDENGIFTKIKGYCEQYGCRQQSIYNNLDDFVSEYNKKPRGKTLLILADGYNEAPLHHRENFDQEIDAVINGESNQVKVIIGSRYFPIMSESKRDKYSVCALKPGVCKKVLHEKGIEKETYKNALNLLKTPFFLRRFLIIEGEGRPAKVNGGAPTRQVYRTHTDILSNYHKHLIDKEKFKYKHQQEAIAKMYVVLEHLLPYIGYRLEMEQTYGFDINWLRGIWKDFCPGMSRNCGEVDKRYCDYYPLPDDNPCDWNCKGIVKEPKDLLKYLVSEISLLNRDEHVYAFSHQIYRDFFAAKHEYNRSRYMIRANIGSEEKRLVMGSNVRDHYLSLFDWGRLEDEYKTLSEAGGNVHSIIKIYNIMSSRHYYELKDIIGAIKYSEKAAEKGSMEGSWAAAYNYKERIKDGNTDAENKKHFDKAYDYARRCMGNNPPHYGGYDIMSQFYIYPQYKKYLEQRVGSRIPANRYVDKALEYLQVAEREGYKFAYNKHGLLYEWGLLGQGRDNRILGAYSCYGKSAQKGEYWALARKAYYIKHFWAHLDDYKRGNAESASKIAFEIVKNAYYEIIDLSISPRYPEGYINILLNLAEWYKEDTVERVDLYWKAYEYLNKRDDDVIYPGMMVLLLEQKLNHREFTDRISCENDLIAGIMNHYSNLRKSGANYFLASRREIQAAFFEEFKALCGVSPPIDKKPTSSYIVHKLNV